MMEFCYNIITLILINMIFFISKTIGKHRFFNLVLNSLKQFVLKQPKTQKVFEIAH